MRIYVGNLDFDTTMDGLGKLFASGFDNEVEEVEVITGSKTRYSPKQSARDLKLVFMIDVPEGVSNERLITEITELAVDADTFHRALGGHGLKVETVEVFTPQAALEPVGGPS